MRLIILCVGLLLLTYPATATSFFNTTDNISFNLDNNAYITLASGQNFINTSEPVIKSYNIADTPKSTLEINFNNTQVRWNSTVNTTLIGVSYNNDIFNFTANAGSGILNFSVKMQNTNTPYRLRVDSSNNNLVTSNATGWAWFAWNTWSQHDFSIVKETNSIPPTPVINSTHTGNFYVNTSWNARSGNITDSYNTTNGTTWINSTSTYRNTTLSPHAWQNLTIYAYNSSNSGALNTTPLTNNTRVPNNAPSQSAIGNKNVNEGSWLNFTISSTDADGDSLTYATNATKGTLTTNTFSWKPTYSDSGVYYWTFNTTDNYSAVATETITVTVNNVNQIPPTPVIN